jgi:hypothetical protein
MLDERGLHFTIRKKSPVVSRKKVNDDKEVG